jgi:hypothetical protein
VWRKVSRPLVQGLHRGGSDDRPRLTPEQRQALLEPHREDIALLERVTRESFGEWLSYREGASFKTRAASG